MGRHSETPHILEKWKEYKLLHAAAPSEYPLAVRRIAKHADRSPTLYYSKTDEAIVGLMDERRSLLAARSPAPPETPRERPTLEALRNQAAPSGDDPGGLDVVQINDRIRRYLEDADFVMCQYQSLVRHLDDAVTDAPAALADLETAALRLQAVVAKLRAHVAARRVRTRATREGASGPV